MDEELSRPALTDADALQLLRKAVAGAELEEEILEALVRTALLQRFRVGHVIISGRPADEEYLLVLEGVVHAFMALSDGQKILMHRLSLGKLLDLYFMAETTRPAGQ